MWVKICGTTTLADAELAVAADAEAVGFVFAPSKRRVTAEQVSRITPLLPKAIEMVGVFHSPNVGEIEQTIRTAGLTAAQLHFPYDAKIVASLLAHLGPSIKLLQVLSCSAESLDEATLRSELGPVLEDTKLWGVLLDASTKGGSGGTGMTFDWDRAASVLDRVWLTRHQGWGPKLILAGGLRPENVGRAIEILRPFGVDVVSGVESSLGSKAPDRVHAFVQNSKQ